MEIGVTSADKCWNSCCKCFRDNGLIAVGVKTLLQEGTTARTAYIVVGFLAEKTSRILMNALLHCLHVDPFGPVECKRLGRVT